MASDASMELSRAFRMAALSGVVRAIRIIIARGEAIGAQDSIGRTPLILAASRGHLEACIELVSAGAEPLTADHDGLDARHHALASGFHDVAAGVPLILVQ
jgi:RNA polymerase primary sigma factor